MKRISFDNGQHFWNFLELTWENGETFDPRDPEGVRWTLDQMAQRMDDETRERVAAAIGPCSDEAFIAAYLYAAEEDLIL